MSCQVQNTIVGTNWFGEKLVNESTASDLTEWGLFGTTIAERSIVSLPSPHKLMENESASLSSDILLSPRRSSARSLLKYAGTWIGDDLEQCLEYIYATRAEAEF